MTTLRGVSPLHFRAVLRRCRRHAALTLVILAMGVAIAAHHGAMAPGESHGGMDMGAVVELCVGAFTAVGAAIVTVALGAWALGRWRPVALLAPGCAPWAPGPPQPRARAGPSLLSLLSVLRI